MYIIYIQWICRVLAWNLQVFHSHRLALVWILLLILIFMLLFYFLFFYYYFFFFSFLLHVARELEVTLHTLIMVQSLVYSHFKLHLPIHISMHTKYSYCTRRRPPRLPLTSHTPTPTIISLLARSWDGGQSGCEVAYQGIIRPCRGLMTLCLSSSLSLVVLVLCGLHDSCTAGTARVQRGTSATLNVVICKWMRIREPKSLLASPIRHKISKTHHPLKRKTQDVGKS